MKFFTQAFSGNSLLHAFILLVFTTALGALLPIVQGGALPTLAQWQAIGMTTLTAVIAYLLKNGAAGSSGTGK